MTLDLLTACEVGSYHAAEQILSTTFFKRVLLSTNRLGYTPLMLAAVNNHPTIVKLLVENGANIDTKSPSTCFHQGHLTEATALIIAAKKGHLNVVEALLLAGANPRLQDSKQQTALVYACANKHKEMIIRLLEYGAEISTGIAYLSKELIHKRLKLFLIYAQSKLSQYPQVSYQILKNFLIIKPPIQSSFLNKAYDMLGILPSYQLEIGPMTTNLPNPENFKICATDQITGLSNFINSNHPTPSRVLT
ncbi:ankyrin repeat domain-containing protein [Gammaproteobacteria bacterium]|nr:ankyrin repeat domain-containing protein [Gammaproteobacteria bacterium]